MFEHFVEAQNKKFEIFLNVTLFIFDWRWVMKVGLLFFRLRSAILFDHLCCNYFQNTPPRCVTEHPMLVISESPSAFIVFIVLSRSVTWLLTFHLLIQIFFHLPVPAWSFGIPCAVEASSCRGTAFLVLRSSHTAGVLVRTSGTCCSVLCMEQTVRQTWPLYLEHQFHWKIFSKNIILK